MNLELIGGTDQQRAWALDAIAGCSFPFNSFDGHVAIRWVAEPPCPGHKEFACTKTANGDSVVSIRNNLDDPAAHPPPYGGKQFYEETVVHELMHAIWFASVDQPAAACALFEHGSGGRTGTFADYNPLSKPWGERIQEAVAEALKDVFFAERRFDNRTNWQLKDGAQASLFALIGLQGVAGGELMGLFNDPGYVWDNPADHRTWWAHQWKRVDIPKGATFTIGADDALGLVSGGEEAFTQFSMWFALLAGPPGHAAPAPTAIPPDYTGPLLYGSTTNFFPRGTAHELEQQGFVPLFGRWDAPNTYGGNLTWVGYATAPWVNVTNQEQAPVPAGYEHWLYAIYEIHTIVSSPPGLVIHGAPNPPLASAIAPGGLTGRSLSKGGLGLGPRQRVRARDVQVTRRLLSTAQGAALELSSSGVEDSGAASLIEVPPGGYPRSRVRIGTVRYSHRRPMSL